MTAVMIGVDPHKATHTAVVIGPAEEPLGELRIRASAGQAEKLVAWAADWPERIWAVEGAAGLGRLLARPAGRRRRAGPGRSAEAGVAGAAAAVWRNGDKNDPNDARSVAVAALGSKTAAASGDQGATRRC